MPGFNETFGGQNIYPSQLTRLALAMTANVTLVWPVEQAVAGANVFADIIDVESATGPLAILMPDATLASEGQATLVNNLTASTITLQDAGGNTVGAVPSGQVWQLYLADNSTVNGTWRTFQFGTGVSSATAAALAGAGLVAITTTLNVRTVPEEQAGTPYAVVNGDRAKTKIWTGGVGVFNLPDPATLGAGWMVYVRNAGTGNLTLTTAAAYINSAGLTDYVLAVGASALFVVGPAGAYWFTLADAGGAASDFNFISINVAGAAGDYTLSGAELNRKSYRFTGALTGNRNIVVPNTIQEYWVSNQTSGAFTLTVKTTLGTGVLVPQGYAAIVTSDGINVVAWEGDPATGIMPAVLGGTGLNTYAQGDLIYASAVNALTRLAKSASASRYLSNQGGSNNPLWDLVNLANGVQGQLALASLIDAAACSVPGRSANSAGVRADIAAAVNDVVLRRTANVLGFGSVPDAALSGNVPLENGVNIFTNSNSFSGSMTYDGNEVGFRGWPFDDDSPHSGDYTLEANDHGRCVFFQAGHGAGDTVTIPSNGSGVFASLGITVLVVNDSDTDTLEVAIDTDTLYLAGTTTTGPQNILPKGAAILYRTQSTEWIIIPLGNSITYPATTETIFAGQIAASAASMVTNPAASGWSVVNDGVGLWRVVHNLGLAAGTDIAVSYIVFASDGNDVFATLDQCGTNSFRFRIIDNGVGLTDAYPVLFHATRLV